MGCCLFAAVKKAEEDRQKKEDTDKNDEKDKKEKDQSDGEEAKLLKKEEAWATWNSQFSIKIIYLRNFKFIKQ